jgi:hypothetical protein
MAFSFRVEDPVTRHSLPRRSPRLILKVVAVGVGSCNDVVAALKALKVPNVRWPGVCFADEYHQRKAVRKDRAVSFDPHEGGVLEPTSVTVVAIR